MNKNLLNFLLQPNAQQLYKNIFKMLIEKYTPHWS